MLVRADTPVVSVTRLVQQVSDLEADIVVSIQKKDQLKLQKLIASDFELRKAASPNNPIPRDTWLNQSLAEANSYKTDFQQIAVHEYNDVMIASFRWQNTFIVDVWKRHNDSWQLSIRYTSIVNSTTPYDAKSKIENIKPTGKN